MEGSTPQSYLMTLVLGGQLRRVIVMYLATPSRSPSIAVLSKIKNFVLSVLKYISLSRELTRLSPDFDVLIDVLPMVLGLDQLSCSLFEKLRRLRGSHLAFCSVLCWWKRSALDSNREVEINCTNGDD